MSLAVESSYGRYVKGVTHATSVAQGTDPNRDRRHKPQFYVNSTLCGRLQAK